MIRKKQYETILDRVRNKNIDVTERRVTFKNEEATLFYIKQLTDRTALSELVLKPLMQVDDEEKLTARNIIEGNIVVDDCKIDTDDKKIEAYILQGMTVLLLSNDIEYAVINVKKVEKRAVPEPETMYTVRGPREALIENLDTNLSLIRYRLKDENLRIDMLEIGGRIKTPVAVLYFEDIANETSVNEVKKRIAKINIDGLMSSGELQAFLLNKKSNLFPQMGISERPDMASGALLEGKVVVLMEGSCWALIAPKVFSEFLWASDDKYQNKYFAAFMRILRVLSMILLFTVSSIYIAIVSFHNDVLPANYMIAIAQSRAKVPFNAFMEVLLIEIVIELIRESLLRVPTKIGTAIGIVGAIIIGQAAVTAGVFSPLLLIVISISLIASFIPADFTIVEPFRVLKFLLIIASGFLGFFGFISVIMVITSQMVSINTFGAPYYAPAAPFSMKDFLKSIIYSKSMAPDRPEYLRTNNTKRTQKRR